eukprot:15908742-Heterocapsa_arctica.AAC.1
MAVRRQGRSQAEYRRGARHAGPPRGGHVQADQQGNVGTLRPASPEGQADADLDLHVLGRHPERHQAQSTRCTSVDAHGTRPAGSRRR